jgi:hypothetical protein
MSFTLLCETRKGAADTYKCETVEEVFRKLDELGDLCDRTAVWEGDTVIYTAAEFRFHFGQQDRAGQLP